MIYRCSALSNQGRQCKATAKYKTYYHGDNEMRNFDDAEPSWVRVYFCEKHIDNFKKKKAKRI
jgi:hypothetical protein